MSLQKIITFTDFTSPFCKTEEEQSLIANRLNEQELYRNGDLPQRKQLLNLYLNRVTAYPDCVQIHINKVPTNILTPVVKDETENPDQDGQDSDRRQSPPCAGRDKEVSSKIIECGQNTVL